MGRYLFEFGLPALLMAYLAFKATQIWFNFIFPSQIKEVQDITKQSEKMDKEITKVRW